ncbi:hypothetical protein [Aeromicrobium sp. 179-A 4D2 NHS]|uniref:hypothetical protein n=1 Tax=Aeromicrobium sp. 179-A 4D2 NHS TaxID=3142375 RepID=UPI0039A297C8
MSGQAITSAIELWTAISDRAGLQERGYDADLLNDVKASLGVPQTDDLATALREESVENLLHAVLDALRPFSRMLSDLLALYEWVGATAADDPNLRITYDFDASAGDRYSFDLESFREHEERWVSATRLAADLSIGPGALWDLSRALGDIPTDKVDQAAEPSLRRLYKYGGTWPEQFPELPTSSDPAVRGVLAEVFEVASEVLAQSRAHSSGPQELMTRSREMDEGNDAGPTGRTLLGIHNDHWLAIIEERARNAVSYQWKDEQERADFIRGLEEALALIPRVEVSQQQLIDDVLDVLSLPVWGKRYELYSAWLLTLIVEALGRENCRFHVVGGVLSFSFRGSHLASIDTAAGQLELWAELRHPYATPIGKGRKRAVQPDYTVTRPPIGAATSAVLAVEAKQYARPSRKNFYGALVDYAGAHVSALVVLANYGPMAPSLLTSPPERCRAVGYVRPGHDAEVASFVGHIRTAVPPPPMPTASESAGVLRPTPRPNVGTGVVLHWSVGLDLDLHLVATDSGTTTNYLSLPDATAGDLVLLLNDDQAAQGVEIAWISEGAGPVEVWVHCYSGGDHFVDMDATVHICSPDGNSIDVPASQKLSGARWWLVGVVGIDGVWETLDRASGTGPRKRRDVTRPHH